MGETGDAGGARSGDGDRDVLDVGMSNVDPPYATVRDVGALLEECGLLLVRDGCSDEEDGVRSSCGDLWLGFDESELDQWAVMSGLRFEQGSNLALRNGFQIQMRVFRKYAN